MRNTLIGVFLLLSGVIVGQDYTYYSIGDTSNIDREAQYGITLMGGATENDDASRWFLERCNQGDVLVLRTSGSDGYHDYFFNELGVDVHSVETIVCHNREAAYDDFVLRKVALAEAIWIAGGDQAEYNEFWEFSVLAKLIRNKLQEGKLVIGGTSAGMAVMAGHYFSAENGTIRSDDALNNPYDSRITFNASPLFSGSQLDSYILDTHYDDPDRRGRHLTFMARLIEMGHQISGIGIDEYTALCIEPSGWATAFGTELDDYVYFVRPNCAVELNSPETLVEGQTLTWDQRGQAVLACKMLGTPSGNRFHLDQWVDEGAGQWEYWSVDKGVLKVDVGERPRCFPFLTTPVSGQQREDWAIVNYVDWSATGIQDPYCGTKTYDGHEGTDFTLQSFPQMDSGVYVLAAADGMVTFTKDGEFDREKRSVIIKGLGNYIAIHHPNDYFSYYGHLKKESLLVQVGDWVSKGDTIAQVASSGNSTDPHLHFELWYDSLYVVDPFKGDCGNNISLWLDSLAYDTTLQIWDWGMHNELIDIDRLREREVTVACCPYRFPTQASSPVLFWSHMYGLRDGDLLTIEWYNPTGILWFQFDFPIDQDWWYYYFWSFINNNDLPEGEWQVWLNRNGETILEQDFLVEGTTNSKDWTSDCPSHSGLAGQIQLRNWIQDTDYRVLDMNGIRISHPVQLRPGMHVIQDLRNPSCSFRVMYVPQ